MKKIRKLIVIIIILTFITGCTGNANIVVNHDGTVSESIDINEINGNIIYGNFNVDESLDLFLKKYEKALKVSKYSTNKYFNEYDSGIKLEKEYKNICDFANNTIFSQYLYKAIICKEDKLYYELYSDGNVVQNSYEDYKEMPDDRTLFIKLPVAAEEQNADEIDGNTYVWRYDENTRDKSFYLKISKSALEQSEAEYNANVSRKRTINTVLVVVGVVALLAIIGFVGVVLYKKYQRNKLDY